MVGDPNPCERCDGPEGSAAAALATVAQFHALPLAGREVAPVAGLPAVVELGELVVASRLLGFDGVPLEGGYDDLPDVPRPSILRLADRFVVLYEIGPDGARVADPLQGVRVVTPTELSRVWTGDCVRLVPGDLEPARARLRAHRRPWTLIATPRVLAFAAATLLLAIPVARDDFGALPTALAAASASSLWLALFPAACAACGRASALAGALPLDRLGAIGYAVLLLLHPRLVGPALAASAGAHIALLAILARARLTCPPCVIVAGCAFIALMLAAGSGAVAPALAAMLLACGAIAAVLVLRWSRAASRKTSLYAATRLAVDWLRDVGPPEPGGVRVVVWKRRGCAACRFYEAVFRPALEQDFAGVVTITELDAGARPVPTPLIFVAGTVRVIFLALPGREDDYNVLAQAVEAARAPSPLGALAGLTIVGEP
jgi:hypothetical protein